MTDNTKGRRLDISLGAGNSTHQVLVVEYHTRSLVAGMSKADAINRLLSQPSLLEALEKIATMCPHVNGPFRLNEPAEVSAKDRSDVGDIARAAIASARGQER